MRELLDVAPQWLDDAELQLNISRVLSKLSLVPACREELLAQPDFHDTALQLMRRHEDDRPLLVRWLFVLGSVTAVSEDVRVAIAATPDALRSVFFFFFTLVTGPRRSLSLKLSDTRVYEPQIRARLRRFLVELFERSVDAFIHEDEPASAAHGPASGAVGPASGREGPASGAAARAGEEGEGEVLKDLLVKLVRLLAHLAISPGEELRAWGLAVPRRAGI